MKYKKNDRGIVTTLPKVSLDSVQYKTLKNQPEFFYWNNEEGGTLCVCIHRDNPFVACMCGHVDHFSNIHKDHFKTCIIVKKWYDEGKKLDTIFVQEHPCLITSRMNTIITRKSLEKALLLGADVRQN